MSNRESLPWEIGFALFFGVPVYLFGFSSVGLQTSFFVHIGFIAIYIGLLLMFGHGSAVEMGVIVTIMAIMLSILFPGFQRAELKKQRRQQNQKIAALHWQIPKAKFHHFPASFSSNAFLRSIPQR